MRSTFAVAAGLVAVASAKTVTTTETADVTITSCSPTHTGNCPYKPESGHWEDWSSVPSDETTTKTTSTTTYDPSHTWADWTTTTTSSVPSDKTTTYDPSHTWADWTTTTTSTPVKETSTTYDPSHTWADWTTTTSTTSTPVKETSTTYDPSHTWADWTTTTSTTPAASTTTASCGVYTATAPPAWFSYLPSDVKSSIAAKWTGAPPADWCYYTYSTSTLSPTTTSAGWSSWVATSSAPAIATGTGAKIYTPSASGVSPAQYTGAANVNAGSFVAAGLAAAAALVIV